MGNRAGYRIREGDKVSHLIRKQWQYDDLRWVVTSVAQTLLQTCNGIGDVGDGSVALRHDLDIGRLTAALYSVAYEPPFDSIRTDPLTCDISDNGLHEIELVDWNHWKIWHYTIRWGDPDKLFDPCLVAEVTFTDGEPLYRGMEYNVKEEIE